MVLGSPGPLLTPPPSSSPPKTPCTARGHDSGIICRRALRWKACARLCCGVFGAAARRSPTGPGMGLYRSNASPGMGQKVTRRTVGKCTGRAALAQRRACKACPYQRVINWGGSAGNAVTRAVVARVQRGSQGADTKCAHNQHAGHRSCVISFGCVAAVAGDAHNCGAAGEESGCC